MGRYNSDKVKSVKVKKSNGSKAFLIVTSMVVAAAGVAWVEFGDQLIQKDDLPLSAPLPLPQVSQPEPTTNDPMLDIAPVQSEPVAEVNITPETASSTPVIAALPADNQATLTGAQQLPELEGSDVLFREQLSKASPKLADWLSADDLIRKYLVLINDIAQETLQTKHTGFLKPKEAFVADEKDNKLIMSAKSYQRYDALAAAIDKMDVAATLETYKLFRPLFAKVFAEFSYPEVDSMEDSFTKAAAEMLVVPIIEQPLELVKPSVNYKYADTKLEALNPVQKQMLRMGPKNTRLIQNKVRQLVEGFVNLRE